MSKIIQDSFETLINRANGFIQNNEELWEEGMKPSLLEKKEFIEYYQQPKYWLMQKPTKGNEKQLEAVRVEVSNYAFS